MSRDLPVTDAHLQRAYAQMRKPDWPPLDALCDAAKRYALVRARATALANGQVLPPEPAGASPPTTRPAPAAAPHALPQRRRDDTTTFSTRAAQAGEYVHPDE